ncbi:MAG: DNA polymerase III subunit beta, partial [Bacteroidota bacterium]
MHITLTASELANKLELVGRVSTKHVTLPVLQCVLLEVKAETLVIRATNLEIGIEASVSAVIQEPGSVAVP